MKLKICLFVCLSICLFALFPRRAFASGFSVGVFPPIIKINASPPVSLQTPIIIKNPTDQTETFNISFKPFTQSDDENGQVRYLKNDELNLKDPLIFQRIKVLDSDNQVSSVELAPGEQKKLTLNIDIPDGESASEYYFSVLFISSSPQLQSQENKSDILTGVATNVLLSIGTKEKPNVKLTNFATDFFKEKGGAQFSVKALNQGNQFANVGGYILIRNLFGQTVGRVELNKTNILAKTSRYLASSGELSKALWPETFLLGPYTATLTLTASDHPVLIRTVHFIGAPIQILIISLIVISLIILVRSKLKSHLRR